MRRAALDKEQGVSEQAASHPEMADSLDAAVIASPHHSHIPIARDLVEVGVTVFCEKPSRTTMAEVEGLRDLVRGGVWPSR